MTKWDDAPLCATCSDERIVEYRDFKTNDFTGAGPCPACGQYEQLPNGTRRGNPTLRTFNDYVQWRHRAHTRKGAAPLTDRAQLSKDALAIYEDFKKTYPKAPESALVAWTVGELVGDGVPETVRDRGGFEG